MAGRVLKSYHGFAAVEVVLVPVRWRVEEEDAFAVGGRR
jgi:hypothetical protein